MNSLTGRTILIWVVFIPIAIANGVMREITYKPVVGELLAHQISTFIAAIAFILLVFFMIKEHVHDLTISRALVIGLIWIGLTVIFEFLFGHYIDHKSWSSLLADYHLENGRIWLIFLLVMFFSPLIVNKIAQKD